MCASIASSSACRVTPFTEVSTVCRRDGSVSASVSASVQPSASAIWPYRACNVSTGSSSLSSKGFMGVVLVERAQAGTKWSCFQTPRRARPRRMLVSVGSRRRARSASVRGSPERSLLFAMRRARRSGKFFGFTGITPSRGRKPSAPVRADCPRVPCSCAARSRSLHSRARARVRPRSSNGSRA